MDTSRQVRSYDYVNRPYERVRDALQEDAAVIFHKATQAAASRSRSLAAELRVDIAGVEIGTEIAISINAIEETPSKATAPATTRLDLAWEATKSPRLFPIMQAQLSIYALTAQETQLDFLGQYDPPMGALGNAVNAVLAHRFAEASVHRFLSDLAAYLKAELTDP